MGLVYLLIFWVASVGIVHAALRFYQNPKVCNWMVKLVVFLSILFPLSISFLLPIDVTSARYNLCRLSGAEDCDLPWMYTGAMLLDFIWTVVFWASFWLTWLIVPLIQGYVDTGEFGMMHKTWDSIRINFYFYGGSAVILAVVVLYLMLRTEVNTFEGIMGFLMALGNAWGLSLAMVFLGHGLVQLPRALWKSANAQNSLTRLEFIAPKRQEQMIDAQAELSQVVAEIQALYRRPLASAEIGPLVDKLVRDCPLPSFDIQASLAEEGLRVNSPAVRNANTVVTRDELVTLKYKLKEALSHCGCTESKWNALTAKAMHLQDVVTNQHYNSDSLWTSSLTRPDRRRWVRTLQWVWFVHLSSFVRRVAAIGGSVLSLLIVASEAAVLFPWADLSLISWVVHWKAFGSFFVECFTLSLLLYLATCTYSSFMKVRIFRYYRLVPGHTDEKSLLFFAAYLCRLSFPLGYNYLTLIEGHGGAASIVTEFTKVMGPMDLIPVMGKNFNNYFAVGLLVVCGLVLFRLHNWAAQFFSSDPNFSFEDYSNHTDHLLEGRELINQARRRLERSRSTLGYDYVRATKSSTRLSDSRELSTSLF